MRLRGRYSFTSHRTRSRAAFIATTLILVTVAAIVFLLLSRSAQSQRAGNAKRAVVETSEPIAATPVLDVQFRFVQGATWTYRLNQAVMISEGSAPQPSDGTLLEARLHVRVLQADARGATLGLLLSHVSVASKSGGKASNVARMLSNTPACVKIDYTGRFLDVFFSDSVPAADQDHLRGILAAMQVVLAPTSVSGCWKTQETDVNGLWDCEYARTADGTIHKRRAISKSSSNGPFTIETEASAIEATVGRHWFEQLRSQETILVKNDGRIIHRVASTFSIGRLQDADEPPLVLREMNPQSLSAAGGSIRSNTAGRVMSATEKDELGQLRSTFAGVPLSASFDSLAKAVASARSHSETVAPMNRLADHLRASPALAAELAGLLRSPHLSDDLASRAVHALELSGISTPESQAALAKIIANPTDYPPGVVSQAAVAAGGLEQILAPELAAALRTLATGDQDEFLRDAAVLALGKLGAGDPALASELTGALSANLDPGVHADDIRVSLWSLANGRLYDDQTLLQAGQLLQHADASVRAAAVEYLGVVMKGQATTLLPLLNDPDESVRVAAVRGVLTSAAPSTESITAVLRIASADTESEGLRGTALNALSAHLPTHPDVETELRKMLGTALPPAVRDQMLQMLTSPVATPRAQ